MLASRYNKSKRHLPSHKEENGTNPRLWVAREAVRALAIVKTDTT